MSRARDFADLAGSADAGGLTGRNLVINGAMQVAQRGTDINGVANGGFCTDRFKMRIANTDNLVVNLDQTTDTPDGYPNSLKLSVGTVESALASDEYVSFGQVVEAQNLQHLKYGTSGAETLSLSFWVKSSVTGTYAISIFQQDASSSPDRRYYSKTYTISSANTWEYKTITISPNTDDVINNDNGQGLRIDWTLGAGSNYTSGSNDTWGAITNWMVGHNASWITTSSATFFLTGVQLEVGEQDTPFEHRSFGDELQRCQRYFHRTTGSTYTPHGGGAVFDADTSDIHVHLPQSMRTSPSLSFGGNVRVSRGSALTTDVVAVTNATGTSSSNPCVAWLRADHGSGYNTGDAVYCFSDNAATGHVSYDAEL